MPTEPVSARVPHPARAMVAASLRAVGDIHRVADCCPVQDDRSVVTGHAGLEFGDRLVGACRGDFDATGDGIPGAYGGFERPIDAEEHRARTGQFFCHDGVEDRAGDAALDDDLPEAGGLGSSLVVVQGIPVTADLSE